MPVPINLPLVHYDPGVSISRRLQSILTKTCYKKYMAKIATDHHLRAISLRYLADKLPARLRTSFSNCQFSFELK